MPCKLGTGGQSFGQKNKKFIKNFKNRLFTLGTKNPFLVKKKKHFFSYKKCLKLGHNAQKMILVNKSKFLIRIQTLEMKKSILWSKIEQL